VDEVSELTGYGATAEVDFDNDTQKIRGLTLKGIWGPGPDVENPKDEVLFHLV
jgi:hypothetical protein